jgi:CubicO group peptidase (beta-lactamase class C family)
MFTRRSAPVTVSLFSIAYIRGQTSAVDFDRITREVIAQQRVVGASVLIARDDKIVFEKGYGFADLGLQAPTKADTVYGVVGPMMPFTGVAIMQLGARQVVSERRRLEIHPGVPLSRQTRYCPAVARSHGGHCRLSLSGRSD